MDYEFTCIASDDSSTSIRISGDQSVEIECNYHEPPTFPPEIVLGPVKTVDVSYCLISDNLTQVRKSYGFFSFLIVVLIFVFSS